MYKPIKLPRFQTTEPNTPKAKAPTLSKQPYTPKSKGHSISAALENIVRRRDRVRTESQGQAIK